MAKKRCPAGKYEVYVGNVGQVYEGKSCKEAMNTFKEYVDISKSGYGRAGGESVTMFRNGHMEKEHLGENKEDW